MNPRALVLSGAGINCQRETAAAFVHAGASARIEHVSELCAARERLRDVELLALPGGFSYGDDTGAGNALAHRLEHALGDALHAFVARGGLVLGVCNGFQVLVRLGLLEGVRPALSSLALLHNAPFGFQCRWVDVRVADGPSPWLSGARGAHIRLPIAHGEGRLVTTPAALATLRAQGQVAMQYAGDNPNGSTAAIAGLVDPSGRVLGLMPHPERALLFHQRDDWPRVATHLARAGRTPPRYAAGAAFFFSAVRALGGAPPTDDHERSLAGGES